MVNLKYISSFIIFGQTRGIKWTVSSDFLAKKKQIFNFMKVYSLELCSVQGVKSLGVHFACLCRGFEFYEVKKNVYIFIFKQENGNTFTLLIILIVKSLQKEQNSSNLLL